MIKKLLIGASALAFATVAHAQDAGFDQDAQAPGVTELNVANAIEVGARFEDLTAGRPANAPAVNAINTTARVLNLNTSPRRESATSVINAVNSSVPLDQQDVGPGNKATVDQDGSNNLVDVDQTGGDEGYAVVNQDGNRSNAYVIQDEAAGSAGNYTAGAAANRALIQQASAASNAGNANNATINQLYTQNTVGGVTRSILGFDTGSNDAVIIQGDLAAGHLSLGNRASLEQQGTNNQGIIRQGSNQTTSGSVANIDQVGFSNFAAVRQGRSVGGPDDAASRSGDIYQRGRYNTANIVQLGQGASQGDIVQNGGTLNQANLVQNGGGQVASILQTDGTANVAFVEQSLLATNATAKIEQRGGNGNYVDLFQNAQRVDADILQRGGDLNAAVVTQNVADSNAHVDTNGSFNNVTIHQ